LVRQIKSQIRKAISNASRKVMFNGEERTLRRAD
jgi:hypothetical protein